MDQNNIFIKNSLDTKKENKMLNNKYEEFFEEISPRLKNWDKCFLLLIFIK